MCTKCASKCLQTVGANVCCRCDRRTRRDSHSLNQAAEPRSITTDNNHKAESKSSRINQQNQKEESISRIGKIEFSLVCLLATCRVFEASTDKATDHLDGYCLPRYLIGRKSANFTERIEQVANSEAQMLLCPASRQAIDGKPWRNDGERRHSKCSFPLIHSLKFILSNSSPQILSL